MPREVKTIGQSIGERIKELRIGNKLSQEDIAGMIKRDRTMISNYERGTTIPPSDVLGEIADALGTSTDYLLNRKLDLGAKELKLINDIKKLTSRDIEIICAMIQIMIEHNK